jgi:hypothetical protein
VEARARAGTWFGVAHEGMEMIAEESFSGETVFAKLNAKLARRGCGDCIQRDCGVYSITARSF